MATRAFWEARNRNDVLERIEIDDANFSGTAFRMCSNNEGFQFSHSEITSESSDGLVSPFKNKVQVGKLDFFMRTQTLPETNLLNDILGSEDTRFTMRWVRDGNVYWTGYVNNKLISYPESDAPSFGTIRANDFEILKGITYLPGGELPDSRQTLIQTISDLFAHTGFGLNIRTATSWITQNTTDSIDFLQQIYHETRALRQFGNKDEEDQPITVFEAIEKMGAPALLFKQLNNEIIVDQLTEYDDPANVHETIYNPDGTVNTQTTIVDRTQQGFTSVSSGTPAVKITSQNDAYPPLKTARVEFQHRSKSGGKIEWPSQIILVDNDGDIRTQSFISDGEQTIEITGQIRAFSRAGGQNLTADIFIEIERPGLSSYYWNGEEWGAAVAPVEFELTDLGADVHTKTIDILTTPLPIDADGILRVNLNSAFSDNTMPAVALETHYLDLNMEISNINNSTSSIFQATQTGGYSETLELEPTIFGDGPNSFAPSALRYSTADNDITAESWERRGFTSFRSFHALLLQDVMDLQRTSVRKLEANLWGDYDPSSVLLYNGAQLYYTAGQYTALPGNWDVSLMEVGLQSGTDSLEEIFLFDSSQQGIAVDSATQAISIQNRGFNKTQYITTTSAAVSGTITSIPINPIGNEWIDAGDIFYVYDIIDASLNEFVLAESQLANDTELLIEEETLADTIPANSWIIYTGELISSYLTRSDTSVRIGVNNHDHLTTGDGQIIGTGDGDELVAGFGNKEAQFQGVGAEIAVNKDSIEATVRDVEGNSSMLRLLSNEAVLKVDSNGNIAKVELDGSADDGSVINIVADDVNINNINFNQEAGTIGSDNFEEAVSGWQIDGDGNAEFNSVALRNGVLEDSELRNLSLTSLLSVGGSIFVESATNVTVTIDDGRAVFDHATTGEDRMWIGYGPNFSQLEGDALGIMISDPTEPGVNDMSVLRSAMTWAEMGMRNESDDGWHFHAHYQDGITINSGELVDCELDGNIVTPNTGSFVSGNVRFDHGIVLQPTTISAAPDAGSWRIRVNDSTGYLVAVDDAGNETVLAT